MGSTRPQPQTTWNWCWRSLSALRHHHRRRVGAHRGYHHSQKTSAVSPGRDLSGRIRGRPLTARHWRVRWTYRLQSPANLVRATTMTSTAVSWVASPWAHARVTTPIALVTMELHRHLFHPAERAQPTRPPVAGVVAPVAHVAPDVAAYVASVGSVVVCSSPVGGGAQLLPNCPHHYHHRRCRRRRRR